MDPLRARIGLAFMLGRGCRRFLRELHTLVWRGRQAWNLVPRRYALALMGAAAIMLVTSAGNTAVALLLGQLVDQVKLGLDQAWDRTALLRASAWVLGCLSVIYVSREGLHVARRHLVESAITRLSRDMQTRLVDHVLRTDLNWLNQDRVGAQHSRIVRSVDGLVRFVRLMFLDCLPAIFTGLFALAAAVGKSPLLGAVMLGVVPLSVWLTIRQLLSQKDVRLKLMRDCEEIDGTIVEQLGGAEYIRVANAYPLEGKRLAAATEKKRQREIAHHFTMSLFGCGKALNEGLFHVLVLATTTYLAIHGQLSFGDILVFSVLYLNVMTPLNEIHRVLDEGHEASLGVADLVQMLDEPLDRSFHTTSAAPLRLVDSAPAIAIENLTASYVAASGELHCALNQVSLVIRHGETIGIAGRSGCGKSTLVKILTRLLHPTGGEVWLGGVALAEISREDIARHIGYVGQSPFLVAGSIFENLIYGCEDAAPADVVRAAQQAELHEEILSLPGGYAAAVSERGQNLSGGQRQRLAIARILLKCPPILILDEATSALDNISERCVQRALGIASAGRTTILIAHRLSTLRDCDQIFVFDAGRIIESGTYDGLLSEGGLFAELVHSAEQRLERDSVSFALS
jgi:ATP-binding cassette subfamily B protein